MAKDGTARGGARVNSGPKKKISKPNLNDAVVDLEAPDVIEGVDIPPIKEYLKAKQKNGKDLAATDVIKSVHRWLKKRGCEKLVSEQLIDQYAMSVSRWIQCEEAISSYGLLGKHPTVTGSPIQSPFVAMSQSFMKQAQQMKEAEINED